MQDGNAHLGTKMERPSKGLLR